MMGQYNRRSALKKSLLTAGAFFAGQGFSYAKTFLTGYQAQQLIFPGKKFSKQDVILSKAQIKAIKFASKVRVHHSKLNAFKASDGSWFIIDQVYGKHEFIDFAIGITPSGSVKGLEVITYRETYGHQIRNPKWIAQLIGKKITDPVKIDKDVKNISGATLSAVHITDGTRRLLNTWDLVLKKF
jgi:Na+-translocating ferredoxin:NAD+ oxidoreductase RnfG subunit